MSSFKRAKSTKPLFRTSMSHSDRIANTNPAPQETSRPSLTSLPAELWAVISDSVASAHPESARPLGMVNRAFHDHIAASLVREVKLDLDRHTPSCILAHCEHWKAFGLLTAVCELDIVSGIGTNTDPADQRHCAIAQLVVDYLPLMSGLRRFVYHGDRIPEAVMLALQDAPRISLHAVLALGTGLDAFDPSPGPAHRRLDTLRGAECLQSLSVTLLYHRPVACRALMSRLKGIILTCHRLRTLALDVKVPSSFQGVGGVQPYHGLGFTEIEQLPALQNLTLMQYPFCRAVSRLDGPAAYYTESYPNQMIELNHWAEMDCWWNMKSLTTIHVDLLRRLSPKLTALRKVHILRETSDIRLSDGDMEAAREFILHVPASLEFLRIPKLAYASLPGLQRHGSTLRELHVHQSDIHRPKWSNECMPVDALLEMRVACAGITELSVDLERNGKWPYDALDVLASFPCLQRLELWFELRSERRGSDTASQLNYVKPRLDQNAAGHITDYIAARRKELQVDGLMLALHCGGATPPTGYGCALMDEHSLETEKTSFLCAKTDSGLEITQLQGPGSTRINRFSQCRGWGKSTCLSLQQPTGSKGLPRTKNLLTQVSRLMSRKDS